MNIESKWRLTYNPAGASPIILLDYGHLLENEPEFVINRGLEVVRIPYGTPILRPTNEDVYQINFGIFFQEASDAAARRTAINQVVGRYSTLVKIPYRIFFDGRNPGEAWDFSSGFITRAATRRCVLDGPIFGWSLRISLTAVGATAL